MTKKQVDKEFERISNEIHKKLKIKTPYPEEVVSRRTLLLFAQVQLAKILGAKQLKNKKEEFFFTALYRTTIEHYFNWA